MSQAAWAPPCNHSAVDSQLNPQPPGPSPCAYQHTLSKQLAPLCLSAYSHCLHPLAPKVQALPQEIQLSLLTGGQSCAVPPWLPATMWILLNPAALSPLRSPKITPFSLFPFHHLCTVDFPRKTRKGWAEEPQGHSCLSNPIQGHLLKPGEFLV